MKEFVLIVLLFCALNALSAGEENIRLDNDCMLDNSIILTEVIYAIDSSFIQDMYDENCKILLFVNIDSSGCVIDIDLKTTLKHSNFPFRHDILKKIEDYVKKERVKFYICYQKDPTDITIDLLKKHEEYPHVINIAIPSMFRRKHLKYMEERGIIKKG